MMLKSILCDYSNAYVIVSGRIRISGGGADDTTKRTKERDKELIFKNCVPFTQ